MVKNRVLIIAYACEPNKGSEPGVSWNLIQRLCKYVDISVIVSARYKIAIEQYLEKNPQALLNVVWEFVDPPTLINKWRTKFKLGTQVHYAVWQWYALKRARKLQSLHNFKLVHHLTYGVTWISPTAPLLGLPFIWGPIGGGDIVPRKLMVQFSILERCQEVFYWFLTNYLNRFSLLSYYARKRSNYILFRTLSTERRFPVTKHSKRIVVSETATNHFANSIERSAKKEIVVLCVGRIQYWKCFNYAVMAFNQYLTNGGQGKLILLGDGPGFKDIANYCEKENIQDKVLMLGNVSANEVKSNMLEADILLHPSYRDGGSWSVLEAMSYGLPVIGVNTSGVADMVGKNSGILVDAVEPSMLVNELEKALFQLSHDIELRKELSLNAQKRIKDKYDWEQRAKEIFGVYEAVMVENNQ